MRDIADWCRLAGAPEQQPDLLATLHAVDSAYTEHRRESRAGMKRVLGAHTPQRYEATTVFRIYEHNVVPGLFQTPEYARAMVQFWIRFLGTPNDVEDAVAVRMQRPDREATCGISLGMSHSRQRSRATCGHCLRGGFPPVIEISWTI